MSLHRNRVAFTLALGAHSATTPAPPPPLTDFHLPSARSPPALARAWRLSAILVLGFASGLPLALIAPVLGIQFDLSADALIVLTGAILLGTPALSGIGAIGAALTELAPVWLHRGEHFCDDNGAYSCAGAPLFDPDGRCMGMLDLTGVDVPERPELRHLVARSARAIEDALLLSRPHDWLMRLNWPGGALGGESDGLVTLDDDGQVLGTNTTARQLLPLPLRSPGGALHSADVFAMPWAMLRDAACQQRSAAMPVPLWSGLRLQALVQPAAAVQGRVRASPAAPLRQTETALIRQAVQDARGNVAEAARALGISRATVYRKLGQSAVKF
mgnify:CR=1 FL=1